MTSTEDVLAQIDAAVEDWTVSADAMRCTPAPGAAPAAPAVPVARLPALAMARATLVLRLIEHHGLSAEVGRAAVLAAERGQHTEYTSHVHAEARAVVAQQTHAAAEAVAAFLQAMRPALEAMAEAAQRAAAAFAATSPKVCPAPAPGRRADRPAWQSPYGPAPRRRN